MDIKKIIPVVLIFIIVIAVAFASCRKPQTFEPAPIITTNRETTTKPVVPLSEYKVFNTQMGMSVEETQKAVGQEINILLSNSGRYYFVMEKENLDFVKSGTKSTVYFIFDLTANLCEVQYETSEEAGFKLDSAIKRFDELYGRHAVLKKEDKENYIWYYKGDYILITVTSTGRNAITYFGEDYFKKNNPEEYKAYNK